MTPLRQRMIDDTKLWSLSANTQQAYVLVVRQLAEHYGRPPDRISQEELRACPAIEMAPRDTLIVGSDGLFDNWRFEEIVERIRCGSLDRTAAAPPVKPDDLTFVLLRRRV